MPRDLSEQAGLQWRGSDLALVDAALAGIPPSGGAARSPATRAASGRLQAALHPRYERKFLLSSAHGVSVARGSDTPDDLTARRHRNGPGRGLCPFKWGSDLARHFPPMAGRCKTGQCERSSRCPRFSLPDAAPLSNPARPTHSSTGISDVMQRCPTEVEAVSRSEAANATRAARWMRSVRPMPGFAGSSGCTAEATSTATRAYAFAALWITTTAALEDRSRARRMPPTPCRRPARRKSGSTTESRCAPPSPAACALPRPAPPAPTRARPGASPSSARSRSPYPVCSGGRI